MRFPALLEHTIDKLFRILKSNGSRTSKNLSRANRVALRHSTYSAISFSFERSPAFLNGEGNVIEHFFGFLLIVEKGDLIAILKAGLELPRHQV